MSLIAITGLIVTGPGGTLIDRYGARAILLAGLTSMIAGCTLLAFATHPAVAAVALVLIGVNFGVSWPGFNALIAIRGRGRPATAVLRGELRARQPRDRRRRHPRRVLRRRRTARDVHRHLPDRRCLEPHPDGPAARSAASCAHPGRAVRRRARRRGVPRDPPPAGGAVADAPDLHRHVHRLRADGGRFPGVRA